MKTDIAAIAQERRVEAANELLKLMQSYNMQFVARLSAGVIYVDVHIDGSPNVLVGGRAGIIADRVAAACIQHRSLLAEMSPE